MKSLITICSLLALLLFVADVGAQTSQSPKDNTGQEVLSVLTETKETCYSYYGASRGLAQGEQWQKAYDTLVYLVEHCHAIVSTGTAFGDMYQYNFQKSDDPNRLLDHLAWSKKVLYYDPDTLYYCEDAFWMVKSFWEYKKPFEFYKEGEMAVYRYLLDSAHCDYRQPELLKTYTDDSIFLYNKWRDTVTDSIKTPFKIVIPSLEELDLTILRGSQSGVAGEPAAKLKDRIMSFTAARNPFADEISLSAELSASTMLHLDIFDELGRQMYSEGLGFKPTGEHRWLISAKGWASGMYYARLGTSGGEVRSVKLVKE